MFLILSYTNPTQCISVNAIVANIYKITELRKRQLKVEILHNLKENLIGIFKFYLIFKTILAKICFIFKKILFLRII